MGLSESARARIWDTARPSEDRLQLALAYIHELREENAALTAECEAIEELHQQQRHAKSIVMDSQQREVIALREQAEALTAERDEARDQAAVKRATIKPLLTDHMRLTAALRGIRDGIRGQEKEHAGLWWVAQQCDKALEAATTPAPADAGKRGDWREAEGMFGPAEELAENITRRLRENW